jgi:hypothetical protein
MRPLNNPPSESAQQALNYAGRGALVFPCHARKRPLNEHGHLEATGNPTIILAWWERWPYADIGIAVTNSFVVVDVEHNGFGDFLELEGREALAVETPIASTIRSGAHLFYRADGFRFKNAVRIGGRAIDVRAVGGYVIAPSPGSGRHWIRPPTGPWANPPKWLKRESEDRKTWENDQQSPIIAEGWADTLSANGRYRATRHMAPPVSPARSTTSGTPNAGRATQPSTPSSTRSAA